MKIQMVLIDGSEPVQDIVVTSDARPMIGDTFFFYQGVERIKSTVSIVVLYPSEGSPEIESNVDVLAYCE